MFLCAKKKQERFCRFVLKGEGKICSISFSPSSKRNLSNSFQFLCLSEASFGQRCQGRKGQPVHGWTNQRNNHSPETWVCLPFRPPPQTNDYRRRCRGAAAARFSGEFRDEEDGFFFVPSCADAPRFRSEQNREYEISILSSTYGSTCFLSLVSYAPSFSVMSSFLLLLFVKRVQIRKRKKTGRKSEMFYGQESISCPKAIPATDALTPLPKFL